MKYSLLDIKIAVDHANDLLNSVDVGVEIIYDVAFNNVRIHSKNKATDILSLLLEYNSVDKAFYFLQGLNTAAMAHIESNKKSNASNVLTSNIETRFTVKIFNKIKRWFE